MAQTLNVEAIEYHFEESFDRDVSYVVESEDIEGFHRHAPVIYAALPGMPNKTVGELGACQAAIDTAPHPDITPREDETVYRLASDPNHTP